MNRCEIPCFQPEPAGSPLPERSSRYSARACSHRFAVADEVETAAEKAEATTLDYCAPGTYYSLAAAFDGKSAVSFNNAPEGSSVTIPNIDVTKTYINGLGVYADGTMYAFGHNRYVDSDFEIYRYTPGARGWEIAATMPNPTEDYWIAGGVDPRTGHYYFGRFVDYQENTESKAVEFKFALYRYNGEKIKHLGEVVTDDHPTWTDQAPRGKGVNGDLAFDSLGNIHIVGGHPLGVDIWTVERDALESANGGTIHVDTVVRNASPGTTTVNGIAYDQTGQLWLSNSSNHYSYNPTTNDLQELVKVDKTVDLSSCVAPPTLTIKKALTDSRYGDEQFALSILTSGGENYTRPQNTTGEGVSVLGSASASVIAGSTYGFSEEVVGDKANDIIDNKVYDSSWKCEDQFGGNQSNGTGTTGEILVPATVTNDGVTEVANVTCTFTNTPLYGSVAWEKRADSADVG